MNSVKVVLSTISVSHVQPNTLSIKEVAMPVLMYQIVSLVQTIISVRLAKQAMFYNQVVVHVL